jgi:hypothetical protein
LARQILKGVFLIRLLDRDFTKKSDGSSNSKNKKQTDHKLIDMHSKLAQKQLLNYQEEIIHKLRFLPPITYGVFEYCQATRVMKQPDQLGLELVVLEKGKINEILGMYKNCTVLLYPEKTTFKPFHKILCLQTCHSVDIKIISKIIRLLEIFDPEITILHILDEFFDDQKIMGTELRQKYISATKYSRIAVKIIRSITIRDIE